MPGEEILKKAILLGIEALKIKDLQKVFIAYYNQPSIYPLNSIKTKIGEFVHDKAEAERIARMINNDIRETFVADFSKDVYRDKNFQILLEIVYTTKDGDHNLNCTLRLLEKNTENTIFCRVFNYHIKEGHVTKLNNFL